MTEMFKIFINFFVALRIIFEYFNCCVSDFS